MEDAGGGIRLVEHAPLVPSSLTRGGGVLKSGVLSKSRGNASVEARIPARIGTRALRTPDSMDVRAYASEIKRL